MTDKKSKLEHREEFYDLYHTLVEVQTGAIDYIREGKDDKDKKARAKEVVSQLRQLTFYSKCWDQDAKVYVDCLLLRSKYIEQPVLRHSQT
jgi:hypothetical protein